MPDFLSFINEILWGSVMIYLLLGAGIWFSWQTRGIQFRYVRKFGRSLKKSLHPQPGGLTSFQALCTNLAARVGSGTMGANVRIWRAPMRRRGGPVPAPTRTQWRSTTGRDKR